MSSSPPTCVEKSGKMADVATEAKTTEAALPNFLFFRRIGLPEVLLLGNHDTFRESTLLRWCKRWSSALTCPGNISPLIALTGGLWWEISATILFYVLRKSFPDRSSL